MLFPGRVYSEFIPKLNAWKTTTMEKQIEQNECTSGIPLQPQVVLGETPGISLPGKLQMKLTLLMIFESKWEVSWS